MKNRKNKIEKKLIIFTLYKTIQNKRFRQRNNKMNDLLDRIQQINNMQKKIKKEKNNFRE
jgi:rhamnogalacturonyl hydrolase YesR